MDKIRLNYKDGDDWTTKEVRVPQFHDLPPPIVTWNDGPKTRYFTRHSLSSDYYETRPVAVIL